MTQRKLDHAGSSELGAEGPDFDRRLEWKYLITSEMAAAIRAWARETMAPDPHGVQDDAYQVHTLYLDNLAGDVYWRRGQPGRIKHRLRRYGHASEVWLEAKFRHRHVVHKRRTPVDGSAVPRCGAATTPCTSARDGWFRKRIAEWELAPRVLVHYERFARIAVWENLPMRLTIDRQLMGCSHHEWTLPAENAPATCLTTHEILELKFSDILPPLFKDLLWKFPLPISTFSKYRTAAQQCCVFDEPGKSNHHV